MSHKQEKHWQSLAELAGSEELADASRQEFTDELVHEAPSALDRRHFMGIMGASAAMASLSGCVRRPVDHIVPYAQQPEDLLPGVPQHFATAMSVSGRTLGVLATSSEGRPIKIEGNPEHPSSPSGGALAWHQGSILDLYDPLRLKLPTKGKKPIAWSALHTELLAHFKGLRGKAGTSIAFLSEAIPSPTLGALRDGLLKSYQGARWYTWEALNDDNERVALTQLFGEPVRPVYQLQKAGVVVSLDSDFLATEGDVVNNAWQWAEQRRINKAADNLSRFYAVEGRYSVTGTNADNRLRIAPGRVTTFAYALAAGFAARNKALPNGLKAAAEAHGKLEAHEQKFLTALLDDLLPADASQQAPGAVIAGRAQPPIVHAIAAACNAALRGRASTVYYCPDASRPKDAGSDAAGLAQLVADLKAEKVDTLVVIGGNPAYDAPGDSGLAEALKAAKTKICLSDYPSETSALCDYVIPRAHYLEAWGDLAYTNGAGAIQQPLINPLHGAWSEIELLARMTANDGQAFEGYEIVRGAWKQRWRAARQFKAGGFHKAWRKWLHDGKTTVPVHGQLAAAAASSLKGVGDLAKAPIAAPSASAMHVQFVADNAVYDGRFANNSWLQEMPDPLTKIAWDNLALVSPATGKALGLRQRNEFGDDKSADMVKVEVGGKSIECAGWIQPGLADNTIVLTLGGGRDFKNFLPYHVDDKAGFDVNPVRPLASPDIATGGKMTKLGRDYPVADVQVFGRQDPGFGYAKRPVVREATIDQFDKNPRFAREGLIEHGKPPPAAIVIHPPEQAIHPEIDYSKGYQWGLVVDLNACTGCNACMIACNAENNIMSVGKDQVRRGREMHWIRMDRYFVGDEADPRVVHQPVMCQMCENAPCENVCPVTATSHTPEGLNDMAYNRCIGTRYCANNCPFKVRRFNFYNYTKGQDELIHMARNPNVTVRFRGVIEKCSYCVQRINIGKRKAKMAPNAAAARAEINGIISACQQTCPTGAITFGDINDPKSKVAIARKQDRNYRMLTELNVKPRSSYLARVTNPSPALSAATKAGPAAKKGG